jgi:glutamine amidotransferase
MKILIVNYGSGNIYSVFKSVIDTGFNPEVITNPKGLDLADKIILPGVGSFYECMMLLKRGNWVDKLTFLVKEKKIPILGICLGMQLFAKSSYEDQFSNGLNFIDCDVRSLKELGCDKVIPHMGWNAINFDSQDILFKNIKNNSDFYFAHSYVCSNLNKKYITSYCDYGVNFTSTISHENIFGTQFHPEKSSKNGKIILKNFLEL